MRIGNRQIGDGYGTYMIAEMSANHAGSLEQAKEIIYQAKEAGADCVKIQTYTADTLTIDCDNKYFQLKEPLWKGQNLYHLYKKGYMPWEWQQELKDTAKSVGIDFFSSPFDKTAVDFLEELQLEFYKIASFELVDIPLIQYVASKGKPIIMSTGMATLEEIKEAVDAVYEMGNKQLALLKCSSAYPAVSKDMNLNTMVDMKKQFGISVGLSDHSLGSLGAVTAVALGANIIEKHFCLNRNCDSPDAAFSMTPSEYKQMVEDIRAVEDAKGIVKYGPSPQEKNNVDFRRSLFVTKTMRRGERFTAENLRSIRPGYGLHTRYYEELLGKTAVKDIEMGTPMSWDLVEK